MYWIHPKHPDAVFTLQRNLLSLIQNNFRNKSTCVFVCIGTPSVLGDCLGPLIGSVLTSQIPTAVYGTLEQPIHANNLHFLYEHIKKQHQKPLIIAIDAALGTSAQNGYIFLKKGPLHPGKGFGKKLPPIGHIQITGVFNDIFSVTAASQMTTFSRCISQAILELYPSFQSTKECDFVDILEISANRNSTGNTTDFNTCRFY